MSPHACEYCAELDDLCPVCEEAERIAAQERDAFRAAFPELHGVNLAKLETEQKEDRLAFVVLLAILFVLLAVFA